MRAAAVALVTGFALAGPTESTRRETALATPWGAFGWVGGRQWFCPLFTCIGSRSMTKKSSASSLPAGQQE